MGRLPDVGREDLDDARLAVWDAVCRARGAETLNEGGALAGPFNAFVQAPGIGNQLLALGNALHVGTSLPMRTIELVILTVGSRWRSEFEWWAHAGRARDSGVAASVIEALGAGVTPEFDQPGDAVLHSLAGQLVTTGRIDDDTFTAAQQLVGHEGLVELVALCGYYTLISFILNGFDVELPPGVPARWAAHDGD
jgi:4-carboxymuconolactone decarboxylase